MADHSSFTQEYSVEKMFEVSRKLKEFSILENELQNLRKDASIYVQQPNSHVFFRNENKDKVTALCKDSIEKLKKQQQNLEEMEKYSSRI